MKKLLALLGLVGIVSIAAASPNPTSVSFISPISGQAVSGTFVYVPSATIYYTNFVSGTNVSNSQGTNANGVVTNYPPFADAPIWANGDGAVNNNLSISITSLNEATRSTNVVNLTFARVSDGENYETTTANQYVIPYTPTGTNYSTLVTNFPSWFLTGTREIRLWSIAPVSTTWGSNITFKAISVNGFAP